MSFVVLSLVSTYNIFFRAQTRDKYLKSKFSTFFSSESNHSFALKNIVMFLCKNIIAGKEIVFVLVFHPFNLSCFTFFPPNIADEIEAAAFHLYAKQPIDSNCYRVFSSMKGWKYEIIIFLGSETFSSQEKNKIIFAFFIFMIDMLRFMLKNAVGNVEMENHFSQLLWNFLQNEGNANDNLMTRCETKDLGLKVEHDIFFETVNIWNSFLQKRSYLFLVNLITYLSLIDFISVSFLDL